jgi:hypothetical protein
MSSSRRGGTEESILAMLERDAGRGIGTRMSSNARMVWFGAGGLLAVGLVGVVVWLARSDPAEQRAEEAALAVAGAAHAEHMAKDHPAATPPGHGGAIVVDAQANQSQQPAKTPPLVLLTPPVKAAVPRQNPVPASAGAVIEDEAPTPKTPQELASTPEESAAQIRDDAHAPPTRLAKAAPSQPEKKRASKTIRADTARAHAATRHARALARTAASSPAHPPAKVKKAPAVPHETPVDSDVALISAVIQHANNQRAQREPDANCGGDENCAAKTTAQP